MQPKYSIDFKKLPNILKNKNHFAAVFVLLIVAATVGVFLSNETSVTNAVARGSSFNSGTWITNGAVNTSVTASDGTVYIGGSFTYVGPFTGYGAALNSTTGSRNTNFPKPNANIYAVVSDGSGGWYIGGDFTTLGSTTRNRIAHLSSDGSIDASFNPNANSTISALSLSGTTLYASGNFTTIGGQARNRIAALSTADGTATSFNPNANDNVTALAISSNGATLYVGGAFTTIGGTARNRIAAINTSDGSLVAGFNPNANNSVPALKLSSDDATLYVGGNFTTIGGQTRNYLAAIATADGTATAFNPNPNSSVYGLALTSDNATLYFGGAFSSVSGSWRYYLAAAATADGSLSTFNANVNAFSTSVNALALSSNNSTLYVGGNFTAFGSSTRANLAAVNTADSSVASFSQHAGGRVNAVALSSDGSAVYVGGDFASISGSVRNRIAAINPTTGEATSFDPNANNTVSSLLLNGTTLYAGGDFTNIGGQARNRIAALSTADGTATAFNPNANSRVYIVTLSSDGATLYAGGWFTTMGGTARNRIAAINTSDSSLVAGFDPNSNDTVFTLLLSGTTLYAGGDFTTIGGQTRNRIAALNTTDGTATSFNPNANNSIRALALSSDGTALYAGGLFTSIGGQTRNYLAELTVADGTATSFNPNMGTNVYTVTIASNDIILHAGGDFTTVGGSLRFYLARFDLPNIQFSAATSSGAESATSPTIALTLAETSGQDITVQYAVTGGTAIGSGTDFTLASGTATVTAGNLTTNISFTVADDALDENDETIIVTISNPTNAALNTNTTHTYTITDNDASPLVQFTSASSSGTEATSPVAIPIQISAVSGRAVTVDYAVTGTATGSGTDYTLANGTATVTTGSTSTDLSLVIAADSSDESDETVIITISNPSNATLGTNTIFTYTIQDDDTPPTTPSVTSPTDSETSVAIAPTLTSSAFSDSDVGQTHSASQWQIDLSNGDFSSPVWDSGTDTTHLTSITVSPSLNYSTNYKTRTRHRDNTSLWSSWSNTISFTTLASGISPGVRQFREQQAQLQLQPPAEPTPTPTPELEQTQPQPAPQPEPTPEEKPAEPQPKPAPQPESKPTTPALPIQEAPPPPKEESPKTEPVAVQPKPQPKSPTPIVAPKIETAQPKEEPKPESIKTLTRSEEGVSITVFTATLPLPAAPSPAPENVPAQETATPTTSPTAPTASTETAPVSSETTTATAAEIVTPSAPQPSPVPFRVPTSTASSMPVIAAQTREGETITISVNDTVVAQGEGRIAVKLADIPEGRHRIKLELVSAEPEMPTQIVERTITIDRTAPEPIALAAPTIAVSGASTNLNVSGVQVLPAREDTLKIAETGDVLRLTRISYSGLSPEGADAVIIRIQSEPQEFSCATSGPTWTCARDLFLPPGTHNVSVAAKDSAGNLSAFKPLEEVNVRAPLCSDNQDNDSDGLIDFPRDPGCSSIYDDDEINILPQAVSEAVAMVVQPIASSAPVRQIIATTQKTKETVTELQENPKIIQTVKKDVAPVTTTASAAPFVSILAINNLGLLDIPQVLAFFFLWLLERLHLRKRRKKTGRVYDAVSKNLLPMARVRVYSTGEQRFINATIADFQGNYSLPALSPQDEYYLQITKPRFIFPTKLIRSKVDEQFENIYRGELFSPEQQDPKFDVPLDPNATRKQAIWKTRLVNFWSVLVEGFHLLANIILATGALISLGMYFIMPRPFHLALFGFYLVLGVLAWWSRRLRAVKSPLQ